MRKPGSTGGLVYSTDSGRMCPTCRRPVADCICKAAPARAPGDGIVRVSRETKGRGGKAVTLVRGVDLDDAALTALGKRLRTACGSVSLRSRSYTVSEIDSAVCPGVSSARIRTRPNSTASPSRRGVNAYSARAAAPR